MGTDTVEELFPRWTDIEEDDLRGGVREAWHYTIERTDTPVDTLPWAPPIQERLGIPDATLVGHINDVTETCLAIADCLVKNQNASIDRDIIIAGSLVHDISKPFEMMSADPVSIKQLLGHPYYGLHVAAYAGLPVEILHIILSHTHQTPVEPATIEAEIVNRGDSLSADAIRDSAVEMLIDAR